MSDGAKVVVVIGLAATLIGGIALLSKSGSKLKLVLNPTGASFYIGDNFIQWGPGLHDIDPGTYVWQCRLSGYQTQTGTVIIKSGQTTNLQITMVAVVTKGTFNLSLTNVDHFIINGTDMVAGTYSLDPGVYNWQATKSGYVTQTGSFTIASGTRYDLGVILLWNGGYNYLIQFSDGSQACCTPAELQFFQAHNINYIIIGNC